MRKIGIQGIKGSYHDQVAKEYFGDAVEINEFLSFDELADSVFIGSSDFGIMAIENSIAGSIIPNYALIDNLNLNIVGECFVNINHQLMALPGVDLNDIETVSSHPMALLQCKKFFKDFPKISLIEARILLEKQNEFRKIKSKMLVLLLVLRLRNFINLI